MIELTSSNVPELFTTETRPLRAPIGVRIAAFLAIVLPLLGVIAVPFFVWGWGFHWGDLSLLLGMYLLTAIGITVGFHRLFVHRSFETFTWIKFVLAAFGSMAVVGSLLGWVGQHRRHHQLSDTTEDPHTPHHQGEGVLAILKGFCFAHLGWFFKPDPPRLEHYVKDINASPALRTASALFPLWIVIGLLIPAILGGLISGRWIGFWTGLIWGGLVRVFLVHHVTWSVNSAGHLWGTRPYHSGDESRNNYLLGILALGEGWHNSHHAFPSSARHGLRWWQFDTSYYIIRLLKFFGLAWNVKIPSLSAQAKAHR